jgi:sugar O-acyltransferase (sialic acid O-acetyltransferase NeuD family)
MQFIAFFASYVFRITQSFFCIFENNQLNMQKDKLYIVGASEHAKVIIDIIEKQGKYQILGLIDANKNLHEELLGYQIIGREEDLVKLLSEQPETNIIIAIGDNWVRSKAYQKIITLIPHVKFASAIHPSAQIAKDVSIGEGTVIMAGAIINSSSKIGKFNIINTKASIDHDNEFGDFVSLAPNATTGGCVSIGKFSAISISATIKHGIRVGEHAVLGAGAVLLKDCADYTVAYGIPAKAIRNRIEGEKYL